MSTPNADIETLKFLKKKKIALLRARQRKQGLTPLNTIREHPKQLALTMCNLPNRWFLGGNRTGKTEWNAHEVARFLHKRHPVIPLQGPKYKDRAIEGWSCCPSYDVQEETTQPKILECLDQNRILDTSKLRGDILLKLRYKADDGTHSILNFKSYEQGRSKFQGAGKDFVSFDEEPPKDVYEEAVMRSRAGFPLYAFCSMTPVNGMCFDEETRILSPRGWLGIDDVKVGEEIYTLNRDQHALELKPIKFIYRGKADDMYELSCQGFKARVNGRHRWWVLNKQSKKYGMKMTKELRSHHVIPRAIPDSLDDPPDIYSDNVVRLAGWFVTDGFSRKADHIVICQSLTKNKRKCKDIEAMLQGLLGAVKYSQSIYHRGEPSQGEYRQYSIRGKSAELMNDLFPSRELTMSFVSQLSTRQRGILFDTLIDGDGSRNSNGIRFVKSLKHKGTCETMVGLCHLLGKRATISLEYGKYLRMHIQNSKRFKPMTHVSSLTIKKIPAKGRMWCPNTDNETLLAMLDGTSYLSSNTWVYNEIYLRTDDPRLKVVTAEWNDNIFLSEDQKLEMAARYTPDALLVREKGLFVQRTGLVCSWWNRSVHLVDDIMKMIPKGSDVYCGIDFGYSQPCAVVYIAVDHDNNRYIFDGFYKTFLQTPQIADIMKRKEKDMIHAGLNIRSRFGDSAAPSDIAELTQLGLPVIPVKKETGESRESWDEYRARLFDYLGRIQPGTGKPKVYASTSLVAVDEKAKVGQREYNWFVNEVENLRWDEIRQSGIITQKPMWSNKCAKHAIDAWSYVEAMFAAPPETEEAIRRREQENAQPFDSFEEDGWVL